MGGADDGVVEGRIHQQSDDRGGRDVGVNPVLNGGITGGDDGSIILSRGIEGVDAKYFCLQITRTGGGRVQGEIASL